MKKKVTILSIISLVLIAGGLVFMYFLPSLMQDKLPLFTSEYMLDFANFGQILNGMFSNFSSLLTILFVSAGGVCLVLLVLHICFLISKKHALSLLESLAFLIESVLLLYSLIIFFSPDFFMLSDSFYFLAMIDCLKNGLIDGWWLALSFVPAFLILVGFILSLIAVIADIVYCASNSEEKVLVDNDSKPNNADFDKKMDNVVVIHDDDTSDNALEKDLKSIEKNEEHPLSAEKQYSQNSQYNTIPSFSTPYGGQSIAGPLLVQYINTYSPESSKVETEQKKGSTVPVSEIQGAISGQKNLTSDDIRKIVREELSDKEKPTTPVIVSVPSPVSSETKEEKKGLTADEVRSIFSEEIKKIMGKQEEDIVVEPAPAPSLTPDDVRKIIFEEFKTTKEVSSKKDEENNPSEKLTETDVREVIKQELSAFKQENEINEKKKLEEEKKAKLQEEERAKTLEEARRSALEQLRKEQEEKNKKLEEEKAKEEAKRLAELRASEERRKALEEAKKPSISIDDIRKIISEEFSKLPKEENKKEESKITPELIRSIIKQEISSSPIKEEKVTPTTVIIKDDEPKIEEKSETKPLTQTPNITVVVNNPAATKEESKPVQPVKRVVGAINPNLPPHDKIIRIPFPVRMVDADKEMKSNYNELKSEILSYGAKSRVSNSGDTFRLHKVTFVKITIAGKSLKLYFGLDPKDYANTPLPVQDVSHKNVYKDIPLVFKVKSELSLRRAKQLIADVMDKNNLEQGKIIPHNWAAELKDYNPANSKEEDEEE